MKCAYKYHKGQVLFVSNKSCNRKVYGGCKKDRFWGSAGLWSFEENTERGLDKAQGVEQGLWLGEETSAKYWEAGT